MKLPVLCSVAGGTSLSSSSSSSSSVDVRVFQPVSGAEWHPRPLHGEAGPSDGRSAPSGSRLRARHHPGAAHQHQSCREGKRHVVVEISF